MAAIPVKLFTNASENIKSEIDDLKESSRVSYSVFMIGFDCEFVDNICKVIAISGPNKILVFHIPSIGYIPNSLLKLIKCPSVLKTGVGLANDICALNRIEPIIPLGMISVEKIYSIQMGEEFSLEKLAEQILGFTAIKKKKITRGNWADCAFTRANLNYVALDAQISYLLGAALFVHSNIPDEICFKFEEDANLDVLSYGNIYDNVSKLNLLGQKMRINPKYAFSVESDGKFTCTVQFGDCVVHSSGKPNKKAAKQDASRLVLEFYC